MPSPSHFSIVSRGLSPHWGSRTKQQEPERPQGATPPPPTAAAGATSAAAAPATAAATASTAATAGSPGWNDSSPATAVGELEHPFL